MFDLDRAVIEAGEELTAANMADERDPDRVATARAALVAAMAARWPHA